MLSYDKMTALPVGSQDQLDGMGKYSVYLHSQPNEALVKYHPPDELREDMESLKSWFEEFKKRDSAG